MTGNPNTLLRTLLRLILPLIFLSAPAYYLLAFEVLQADAALLIPAFCWLFAIWFAAVFFLFRQEGIPLFPASVLPQAASPEGKLKEMILLILLPALLFRLTVCFSLPALSDDFYRYLWDGHLSINGLNPFRHLPADLIQSPWKLPESAVFQQLFPELNSPGYFTVYPPFAQGLFALAARLFPDNIFAATLLLKGSVFLAEAGSIAIMLRLLHKWKLPLALAVLYAWNPLVITELCGNLHLEAFMIFFLLAALLLLESGKWKPAAIPFALAICSKLIPLMLVPLLIRRLGWGKSLVFGLLTAGWTFLAFFPFWHQDTLPNLLESTSLYFQHFEFNGGIYYVLRWAGSHLLGYNPLGIVGPVLGILVLGGILWLAFRTPAPSWKNFPVLALGAFSLYLFLGTTIHPWYVSSLVALSVFSGFRYALVWSALIPLTYLAYQDGGFHENLLLVSAEYLIVFGILLVEFRTLGKDWKAGLADTSSENKPSALKFRYK
jgi:hypothetical protein